MPKIEIEYNKDGTVKVEAFGFEGESCLDATKEILEHHGGDAETTMKDEFYEEESTLVDTSKLCG